MLQQLNAFTVHLSSFIWNVSQVIGFKAFQWAFTLGLFTIE